MDKKEPIFTTTDPLNRKIILKNDTWEQHIKDRHGETGIIQIKSNIENPRYILQNIKQKGEGNLELIVDYTRQDYIDLIIVEDKMHVIKTIVQFDTENEGFVVTNHILRKAIEIKTWGGVIYDRNKG